MEYPTRMEITQCVLVNCDVEMYVVMCVYVCVCAVYVQYMCSVRVGKKGCAKGRRDAEEDHRM